MLSNKSCPSLPKSISSNDSFSAIDDKTSKAIVDSGIFSLTVWIVSSMRSTLSMSDFEIISVITAILSLSSSDSFNIWVNILSLISLLASKSEEIKNELSSLAKLVITLEIKSLLVSNIISIDWPILAESEIFKILDKNSEFSEVEYSTIKFIFSCFSVLIFSTIISTSFSSIVPSLLASSRSPFNNFSSNFDWIKFSLTELASTNAFETSSNSIFSSSVLGLSEIPEVVSIDTTCSVSNKVFNTPSEEMFITPTFPKLSLAKLTSEVPFGLFFILNLVPFTSIVEAGSSMTINPLFFFEILPDSIIMVPISVFPKNISFNPKISNSVTSNDDDSLIIIVELSLYSIVILDSSFVKILSFNKISSYKSNNLFSPSTFIAITSFLRLTTVPIFSDE